MRVRGRMLGVVEPVGLSAWLRRAESRLGEPVEAACSVVPKSSVGERLAEAALTGEATELMCLVVTARELLLFDTRRRGWTLRPHPGDELLRVSLTDIERVVRVDAGASIGFRVVLKDGREISSLGAARITRGDAVLARLVELVGHARRPEHDAIVRASGHSGL
jgi:hypothetical protein